MHCLNVCVCVCVCVSIVHVYTHACIHICHCCVVYAVCIYLPFLKKAAKGKVWRGEYKKVFVKERE